MATTIYEKTPGALVATGTREVSAFPSNLCRVDRVYVCAKANAATHRATLAVGESLPDDDESPAVDGLFIFPAARESENGQGFTEFQVSGYGRTATAYRNYQQTIKTYSEDDIFYSVYETEGSITIRRGESLTYDDLELDPVFAEPFGYAASTLTWTIVSAVVTDTFTGQRVNWDGTIVPKITKLMRITYNNGVIDDELIISYQNPEIVVTAIRNFGEFTELDITTRMRITGDGLSDPPSKT